LPIPPAARCSTYCGRGSQPAGQIAEAFPISRPAISKHLRLLRRAQLVRERREGRHRVYELNPEPLRAVDSWIEHYRSFWTSSLANLKAFVEAEHARESWDENHILVSCLHLPDSVSLC